MNKEEKLLYSLSAIKNIFECFDIDVEIKIEKNDKEYIVNAYKEIEKCVVDYVNSLQPYKFEDFRIGLWVYDSQPECEEFTFFKITKILLESDCDYLYHDKNKKVFIDNMTGHAREFEEDRFFPVTKALRYCPLKEVKEDGKNVFQ